MVDVVDVKAMSQFKSCKMICPCSTNLSSNIDPKLFYVDIVNTPTLSYRHAGYCFDVSKSLPPPNI